MCKQNGIRKKNEICIQYKHFGHYQLKNKNFQCFHIKKQISTEQLFFIEHG